MNNHSTPLKRILFVDDSAKELSRDHLLLETAQAVGERAAANTAAAAEQPVNTAWLQQVSGPAVPTTTQPGETAAALPPTGATAVSSRFTPKSNPPIAKETLVMDNKDSVLLSRQTAEANRKQLLKELAANIEQLCLALSMGSPNLVELQETKGCAGDEFVDMTWFQKVSTPTPPKSGKTPSAPSTTGVADVSFRPRYLANARSRADRNTL